jgi:TFIIF-interacting CTD phosphatase-like protein
MSNRKNPQQLYFQKDLQILTEGRSLSSMLIVDNRAVSFAALHLANGVPIKDYEGDKTDEELPHLREYLIANFLPTQSQSMNT